MRCFVLAFFVVVFGLNLQAAGEKLRVGVVGLVHGHVRGFLNQALKTTRYRGGWHSGAR